MINITHRCIGIVSPALAGLAVPIPGWGYLGPKLLGTCDGGPQKSCGCGWKKKKRKRASTMGGNKQNKTKDYPIWVLKKYKN